MSLGFPTVVLPAKPYATAGVVGLTVVDTSGATKNGYIPSVNLLNHGADKTGVVDCTTALGAAQTAAIAAGAPLFIPGGSYKKGATTYPVDGKGFLWFDKNFDGAVDVMAQARQGCILLTGATDTTTPNDPAHNRTLLNLTLNVRGDNHGNPARFDLYNYSTFSGANTAGYFSGVSDVLAVATFSLHGETKHGGGTTIAVSSETATYTTSGSAYGLVVNNSTSTAASTHPTTGASKAIPATCTAIHVVGDTTTGIGMVGGWRKGLNFTTFALRDDAYGIHFNGAITNLIRSETTAISSSADIFFQGNSNYGIILAGTYTTAAFRINADQVIALENTATIKFGYQSSGTRWVFKNGATEKAGINTTSGAYFVQGTQVVGTRDTGWTADTGTAKKTANATYAGTAEASYTQATIQTLMDAVRDATRAQKSIKDALISHGLVGA